MKTKLTLLLLTLVVACVIATQLERPDTAPSPRAATPADAPDEAPAKVPAIVAEEDSPEPDSVAAAEPPATEMVMGIEVRKDRHCSVQRHYIDLGNGTVTDAYSCVPNETAVGEYDHYSDDELRVLSYNDARAASVLGKRLVEVDLAESRRLLLRAVALKPANLDPVMWLAAQAYSLRGESPAAQSARANAYVLTRTAQAMGSAVDVQWILEDLDGAGFGEKEIAVLEERVRENLRRIREIQLEIYGESLVDEVLL